MSERLEGLLAVAVLIGLSFAFQFQMKLLANEIAPLLQRADLDWAGKSWMIGETLVSSWRPVLICLLAVSLFLLWFLALTRLELSVALPVASLALVTNAIGSGVLLGEAMGPLRIGGVLLTAVGIAMVIKS